MIVFDNQVFASLFAELSRVFSKRIIKNSEYHFSIRDSGNKLALLWGEAQKKIAYSYLKITLCYPNVNYSGLKVTYS